MNKESSERFDEMQIVVKWVKSQVIDMLGIGLIPMEDPDTGLLRMPKDSDEYTPLALMIAREDVLKTLDERVTEYINQESARLSLEDEGFRPPIVGGPNSGQTSFPELSADELEEFMKDDGDIAFENAPEDVAAALNWGNSTNRMMVENLVLNKDDLNDDGLGGPIKGARTMGQTRRDFVSEQVRKIDASRSVEPDFTEIDIVSDDSHPDGTKGSGSSKISVSIEEDD